MVIRCARVHFVDASMSPAWHYLLSEMGEGEGVRDGKEVMDFGTGDVYGARILMKVFKSGSCQWILAGCS